MLALLAMLTLVAGCASQPEAGFLVPTAEVADGASEHSLLVATTRERDARPGRLFNGERSGALDYAAVTVSIPPTHVAGEIEWPSSPPGNPGSDFVVRQAKYLNQDEEFVRDLNAELALRPRGSRKVFIYIHGFNTVFADALYRLAQIEHDAELVDVPVLFSWASRGDLTDYVYDNNSATAARDELAHTFKLLLQSNAEQVNILAHSMGNWVTVEALRQLELTEQLGPNSKIGYIFLAAPDIDVDVFKSQLRQFKKPVKTFYVIISKDDQALRLSSFIAGGKPRLGSDGNTAELNDLGATVIDLTQIRSGDSVNHGKFAELAKVAPQLLAVLARRLRGQRSAVEVAATVSGRGRDAPVAPPLAIQDEPVEITGAH